MLMPGRKYSAGSAYRYGFNGKEKDNEITSNDYDFGARIYDSRIGRWLSVDPLSHKYPGVSCFSYVANTPINAIDPDGQKVLFVNGYWDDGFLAGVAGDKCCQDYWTPSFIAAATKYFGDTRTQFIDGKGWSLSAGKTRFDAGYEYAKANFDDLTKDMIRDADGNIIETFKVVSHSMGGAYAEGIIKYLEEKKLKVDKVVHLSITDADDFKASPNPKTLQLSLQGDPVIPLVDISAPDGGYELANIDAMGVVKQDVDAYTGLNMASHYETKANSVIFDYLTDLENIQLTSTGSVTKKQSLMVPSLGGGGAAGVTIKKKVDTFSASGNTNNTQFKKIVKDGKEYQHSDKNNQYEIPHQ